jgi:hypothetical protein
VSTYFEVSVFAAGALAGIAAAGFATTDLLADAAGGTGLS